MITTWTDYAKVALMAFGFYGGLFGLYLIYTTM
jgi:hypothetical protein